MHPTDIPDEDPELLALIDALMRQHGGKPVAPITVTIGGPYGRTKTYEEIAAGRLITFETCGRRYVLLTDYARYLLALKRGGAAVEQKSEAA
jgi:hypothetical protein